VAKRAPKRSIQERISDPGEESTLSRAAIGCIVAIVAVVLIAGGVGIAVGARSRMASFGGEEESDEEDDTPPPPIEDDTLGGGTGTGGTGPNEPPPRGADDMRRRYRPGPLVRVESMVPSGRLLPDTVPGQVIAGRTVDNPWIVPGAELEASGPPPTSGGGPSVWHDPSEPASTPLTVIARTPARVQVRARDANGGTNVVAYVVEFVGYQGHFRLASTAPTELGAVQTGSDGATIHFAIQSPVRPDRMPIRAGEQFPVTMRIAGLDDQGRVSSYVTRELSVMAVGAGDVEVTLAMGEPTDLDLYVTDPTGVTIYYGNTNAGTSGGHLDLDANAACSSNVGVNNEHVYWPQGQAPSGTYRVHVAHWRNCVGGRPVSYRVTVRACGETVVLSGNFQGMGQSGNCTSATAADAGWCQEVVTFDVPPCGPEPRRP
jgi:hypothetical protein